MSCHDYQAGRADATPDRPTPAANQSDSCHRHILHNPIMQAASRRPAWWTVAALSVVPLTLAGQQDQRKPDFRSSVELVTTDVVVRDKNGQFLSDLKIDDFELLEDGVPQKLVSFSMTHGGRTYNIAAPTAAPVSEGILLPARVRRPTKTDGCSSSSWTTPI